MKFLKLKFCALVACLFMGGNAFAYTFSFSNHTKDALVIYFKLMAWHEGFAHIVKPGKRVIFSWAPPSWFAGYCMDWAQWAKYDPNLKIPGVTQNGGLDLYQGPVGDGTSYPYDYGRNNMMTKAHGWLVQKLPMKNIELVYLPDELYAATVKAASNIGSGIDTFFCNAVVLSRALNKGKCPTVLADIINWFGGIISRSACRDREIIIVEDPKTGQPVFTTLLN